jgi:hypothetical protein
VSAFGKWAAGVKADIDTPDLWDNLKHVKDVFANSEDEDYDNTPFTEYEQEHIAKQISAIKEYVKKTYSATSELMSHIEARLDEAEKASHRIGRKDWLMAFNGAVFSLVLTDFLPQQAAQHILVMALQGLGHLFGIGGPPQLPQ